MVHFDLGANEVIEVIDLGEVPLPPNRASYYAEDQPSLRAELKPISITQPDGPSFTVEGNLVAWAQWRFRVAFDPYEGLVLHQVAYDDDGRDETVRCCTARRSARWWCPTAIRVPDRAGRTRSTRGSGGSAG